MVSDEYEGLVNTDKFEHICEICGHPLNAHRVVQGELYVCPVDVNYEMILTEMIPGMGS